MNTKHLFELVSGIAERPFSGAITFDVLHGEVQGIHVGVADDVTPEEMQIVHTRIRMAQSIHTGSKKARN